MYIYIYIRICTQIIPYIAFTMIPDHSSEVSCSFLMTSKPVRRPGSISTSKAATTARKASWAVTGRPGRWEEMTNCSELKSYETI